jgi:TatD DNase family protein
LVQLTDSHCHLDFESFDKDREAVLQRAFESGIHRIVNPGLDLESSRRILEFVDRYPALYAAVGIHPNEAGSRLPEYPGDLYRMARHPKTVAIGEIGLDYYRDETPREIQRELFQSQLNLAADTGLPVVIHSRNAIDEILETLRKWYTRLVENKSPLVFRPGVLHAFEGSVDHARQAMEMNFFIGIGGPVTFRNAQARRDVAAALPLDHILLETDSPLLAPHPHRGQRNEPANIRLIAETLADLIGKPLETVAEVTSNNATRLFAWST